MRQLLSYIFFIIILFNTVYILHYMEQNPELTQAQVLHDIPINFIAVCLSALLLVINIKEPK